MDARRERDRKVEKERKIREDREKLRGIGERMRERRGMEGGGNEPHRSETSGKPKRDRERE